jgi:hypothetical protein
VADERRCEDLHGTAGSEVQVPGNALFDEKGDSTCQVS